MTDQTVFSKCLRKKAILEEVGEIIHLGGSLNTYEASLGRIPHREMVASLIKVKKAAQAEWPSPDDEIFRTRAINKAWTTYVNLRIKRRRPENPEMALLKAFLVIKAREYSD